MHAPVPRTQFHCLDVPPRRRRNRDYEIAIYVLSAGRQRIRFGHLHDQVWLPELPPLGPLRGRGQVRRCTFDGPFRLPLVDKSNLINCQVAFARKLDAGFRGPWWHVAALRNGSDVFRMLFHLAVIKQLEWAGLAGPMTLRALGEDNGRDILRESYRAGRT